MSKAKDLWAALEPYRDRRIVATFGLGMSSGFPLTFVISLLGIWLSRENVSATDVGFMSSITVFYMLKFLWSPAIDHVPLGPITRFFGQRRGWLFTLQFLIAAGVFYVAQLDPSTQLFTVALIAGGIAFLSASQDIVIDAYRIEIFPLKEDQGYSAAAYVYGYRTANYVAGVGVLLIANYYGWATALTLLPLLLLPGVIGALVIGEPEGRGEDAFLARERSRFKDLSPVLERLREAVYLPFKEFTRRRYWFLILLFILLFKAGDAVTAIMTGPFIVAMGFTDLDIATANKTIGFITLMVGVGVGAELYKRIGIYRALFFTGVLMMLTNLGFAWLALGPTEVWRLALTIGLENFATGLGTTVAIAYFASLCNVNFTATQYALLSSLGNLGRTALGVYSGVAADHLGWFTFFLYATAIALPGLILLFILWKKDVGTGNLATGDGKADI